MAKSNRTALIASLLFPVLALAQVAAPAAPAAPNPIVAFFLSNLPWLVCVAAAIFLAYQSGIIGFLQAKRDAASTSAAGRALCSGALILDHLAADFAGKLAAELKTNPALKAADLLPAAATAAKATLSADGADALQEALGVAAGGLEARIGAAVAAKLGGAETHVAAAAGAQAAAAVKAMPLSALAAQLSGTKS